MFGIVIVMLGVIMIVSIASFRFIKNILYKAVSHYDRMEEELLDHVTKSRETIKRHRKDERIEHEEIINTLKSLVKKK